jgi:hypothetical protein
MSNYILILSQSCWVHRVHCNPVVSRPKERALLEAEANNTNINIVIRNVVVDLLASVREDKVGYIL